MGGLICPTFNPEVVTHIITSKSQHDVLDAVGAEAVEDLPEGIVVVKDDWVDQCFEVRLFSFPLFS
jgi:hypothetical protein